MQMKIEKLFWPIVVIAMAILIISALLQASAIRELNKRLGEIKQGYSEVSEAREKLIERVEEENGR